MNPRSLPFHACAIGCVIAFGLQAPAAEPALRFRWLETDPKTGDSLLSAIKAKTLSADALGAKVDQLVKGGQIIEVVAFNKKFVSGERFLLKPEAGKMPLLIEAEANASRELLDLRCALEWTPKTPKGSGLLRINTSTMFSGQHWHLFGRWGDAKTETLLLACGSGLGEPTPDERLSAAVHPPVVIHLDAEWRETTSSDLAKVAMASPESRSKALAWLRGRSTLLASTTGTCKSGQKSMIEYLWGGKSDAELEEEADKNEDDDPKEPPPRPGVVFEWEPILAGENKLVDSITPSTPSEEVVAKVNQQILGQELSLRLLATYVPLKSRGKPKEMEFEFQGILRQGVPEFVAAKADPQSDQPVVLVLTPWYDIIR